MVRIRTVRLRGLTAVWLVAASGALAADWSGSERGQVGGGVGGTRERDLVSDGGSAIPDGFLRASSTSPGGETRALRRRRHLRHRRPRASLTQPEQDTLIQSATLLATAFLPRGSAVNLEGRARDRRGAERDYTRPRMARGVGEFQPDDPARLSHLRRVAPLPVLGAGAPPDFLRARGRLVGAVPLQQAALHRHLRRVLIPHVQRHRVRPRERHGPHAHRDGPGAARPAVNVGGFVHVEESAQLQKIDDHTQSFGEKFTQHRIGLLLGVALPWS